MLLVHNRRAWSERFGGIKHRRQRLVLDANLFERALCGAQVLGRNDGNELARMRNRIDEVQGHDAIKRAWDKRRIEGIAADELLRLAAAVERASEHPLGAAVVRHAEARGLATASALMSRSRG